jgi:CHAD domain-containing protein
LRVGNKITNKFYKKQKKIIQLLNNIKSTDANKYLQKKELRINRLFREEFITENQLHKLRQELKEFYYFKNIFHKKKANRHYTEINYLQELLGKWHDYKIINDNLKKTITDKNIHPEEINNIKKMKTDINKKENILLIKIKQIINKSIHLTEESLHSK